MKNVSFKLVVQQDLTILANEQSPDYAYIRAALQGFAELVKNPGGIHTFKMTPISLWNAAASGKTAEDIVQLLERYSSYPIPMKAKQEIFMWMGRYGLFILEGEDREAYLTLHSADERVLERFMTDPEVGVLYSGKPQSGRVAIQAKHRGRLKRALARAGYPVIDRVGFHDGEPLSFRLAGNGGFRLRPYQEAAVQSFIGSGERAAGDGVVVLPCGAGKTIVGIGAMTSLQSETLILTSNTTSVKQWKQEILKCTTLEEDQIGEYTGASKKVRPVTISTYQMMTYRQQQDSEWHHMRLFHERDWGLIVYDEVHLLPAPVFRTTADLQATRRLGLTATLVREDGCERDVFSLIGPKRYELPWRQLEEAGWIAEVVCTEVRVPLTEQGRKRYNQAGEREKARIAGENETKSEVSKRILERHPDVPTLVIGQYLTQLKELSEALQAPVLTGQTPQEERERLYSQFKQGEIQVLVVSKVANFAVDLPDATVAIQVSGSFGSRQEEAQRLGRLLRPKSDGRKAYFYTLVSEETKERDYAMKRQLFLVEQGYRYHIEKGEGQHKYVAAIQADGTG
ncbi:DNA repair helicase XPB [Paenibacillus apiarius]|uniref:DNA 3'-5' helicase n=1 Tax=Paenibacillus apiarius TaxID=46240 RepID=A0ABT4DLJ6_9BACL|nr:DNA repair helicase XPB [Paenibacillus apiarius]MCY9513678.1 DEAD/DEAH box helicase [Paenibacillus apiarius]MCY9518229.1 DEAD/DEAH box helicase [Paenibacillus apiarius]MCY9551370.1 DEAD/DEAH box helicase [Paenibacillus apiarius]MCY9558524.1 DEAD/DEAH box helicase [Paenibacillus apiarius]MCY9684162.1 DEAD/DEAH box helicase [Paenibacillus apiarius]